MPAQWTAEVVMEMHMHRITKRQLAQKLGVTPEWVGRILNGKNAPSHAEQKFRTALEELIQGHEIGKENT